MRYRFKRIGDSCQVQYRFGFFFWLSAEGWDAFTPEGAAIAARNLAFKQGHVVELVP